MNKQVSVESLIKAMEKYVEFGKVLGYDFTWCKEDMVLRSSASVILMPHHFLDYATLLIFHKLKGLNY